MRKKLLIFASVIFVFGLALNVFLEIEQEDPPAARPAVEKKSKTQPAKPTRELIGNQGASAKAIISEIDKQRKEQKPKVVAKDREEIAKSRRPVVETKPQQEMTSKVKERAETEVKAEVRPQEIIASRFYRTKKLCYAKKQPQNQSPVVTQIKKGKKVWVDGHNQNWGKIYLKGGASAYISKDCLN